MAPRWPEMALLKNQWKIDIFVVKKPQDGHVWKNLFQKGLKMTLRWLGFPFNFIKKLRKIKILVCGAYFASRFVSGFV
jgi:hypothetical protein